MQFIELNRNGETFQVNVDQILYFYSYGGGSSTLIKFAVIVASTGNPHEMTFDHNYSEVVAKIQKK